MKTMYENKYPFDWLDVLIEKLRSFPTEKNKEPNDLRIEGMDLLSCAEKETGKLKLRIRGEIFVSVAAKKSRKLVANYYHETITCYMNVLYHIGHDNEAAGAAFKNICGELHGRLRFLLDFLENHFGDYLGQDRKVPRYYLLDAKKKLQLLLDAITKRNSKMHCTHTQNVIGIVCATVSKFILQSKYPYPVTYRCVAYRLNLLRKIMELPQWKPDRETGKFPLDNLLLFMNFNSKTYIAYLTCTLAENIGNTPDADKVGLLLGYYKGFRQLHSNPNDAFNPEYHNILNVLDKWFDEELSYFRKIVSLAPVCTGTQESTPIEKKNPSPESKVLCTLSGDQIALLLRAADEVRMLSARSLTAVFRSIVPHLSTRQTPDLSYESIRSKSYNAEQTDKEVTIHTLRRMIQKIQDY
ncbi:hypothetical protein NU10_02810 [Flavobacterium dauae]|uniref:hypothetical protein n=1 Tax=Flavobacterium dauae TaxID=1563479 RepID=UPI00101D39A3|nr:hypothetical protein [Flavobacterium dauae]WLD24352.1 hypothetical protein NU10_02810 [Flavobacterium dauae]